MSKKIKTIGIEVERAELRKGKIIIVLKPDLLTNQEFAVSPFYDEGSEKNMLQSANIGVHFMEKDGKIKVQSAEYRGSHFTTGHRQIYSVNDMYINKKDCVISEILQTEDKYIEDDSRMNKLLSNWDSEPDFRLELEKLIAERKKKIKKEKIKAILANYEAAKKDLEAVLSEDISKIVLS